MADENAEIVGFDLGHGESALTVTRLSNTHEPMPLDIGGHRSTITAVGIDNAGRIVLGADTVSFATTLTEGYVRFKHPKLDNHPIAGKATRLFVRGILNKLIDSKQLADPARALFIVGCPSGWGPEVQAAYQRVLEEGGLVDVRVVPESRAAFVHAREKKELTSDEIKQCVLLIDIGSSTTDFTYISQLNQRPIDFGHTVIGDIGGGLFDQLVFEHALASQSNPEAVKSFFDLHPGVRNRADLDCRGAKEEYFNGMVGTGAPVEKSLRLDKGLYFEISVDDVIMDKLKKTPIASLGGKSWIDAFRDRLLNARKQNEVPPDFIIVTGGAARMAFVDDIVQEVFPDTKKKPVRGKEPELAVAKGLAWFGRLDIKSGRFRAEVKALADSAKVENVVAGAIPGLYDKLARGLARAIVDHALRPEILRWRSGGTRTMRQMERRATEAVAAFLADNTAKQVVSKTTMAWFEDLRPKIHELTDPICRRYGLETSALDLSADTYFSTRAPAATNLSGGIFDDVDQIGTVINAVVATVTAMVLGGAGVALLHLPLIGQVVAGVLFFVALMIGKEKLMEMVKDWDLPNISRKVVSENRINSKLEESFLELKNGLQEGLTKADDEAASGHRLADRVAGQIDRGILQRGDDAILQFK
jgi:hypothetical protein